LSAVNKPIINYVILLFQPSGGRPIGDDEPEQGCPLRKHNFAFASCNQIIPNTGARIIITKSIRFWVC
jgi:hypothetical protein